MFSRLLSSGGLIALIGWFVTVCGVGVLWFWLPLTCWVA